MDRDKQRQHFWAVLKGAELGHMKKELVLSYSNGRTSNSSELTDKEMGMLIKFLQKKQNEINQKRTNTVLILAHQIDKLHPMGWTKQNEQGKNIIDIKVFNNWLVKKQHMPELKSMNMSQLNTLIGLLKKMTFHYTKKKEG